MRTIKKRLSAVLLSVYMVFGVVSTDYLTVQAFEWVVPSLTVGESLLWLMGLLGMTYTEGASAWRDVSSQYEQEFIDYANEHGLTYTETSTWLNDTASGKLNQLSQVWSTFKDWVKSLVSSSSDVSQVEGGQFVVNGYNLTISDFSSYYNSYQIGGYTFNGFFSSSSDYSIYDSKIGNFIIASSDSADLSNYTNVNNLYSSSFTYDGKTVYYVYSYRNAAFTVLPMVNSFVKNPNTLFDGSATCDICAWLSVFGVPAQEDLDFASYNPALIPDINFAGANTEDASIPGVIDLPWGNVGDDEEERDKTYDDLVGGLDLGKEIGDLWQALQDLMGVLAVDDAGVLQPNSGGENPPTLEDEAENNKVNGAFVLTGLQKVFPFCIPFDLYAFITLLEAPPVAPVIQYPIYNPVTKSNEIITIDFSTWESVVILFRYIFDFLFIIGLLLMARALIGGGDSA